jgi:hypothetical protein
MKIRTLVGFPAVLAAAAMGVTAPAVAHGLQTTEAFDCGSKKLTVWLWPKGNPKGWAGFEKDSAPQVHAFNGWAAPPSATSLAGGSTLAGAIHAGIAGVEIGSNCAPKGSKKLHARSAGLARLSSASRLRCTFPSNPLIQIETLPNSSKRLNLVVANKLVITGFATVTTATVNYAKQYCTVRR